MKGPIGYKIDLTDYDFETYTQELDPAKAVIDKQTGEPVLEKRKIKVLVKISLPLMITNSIIGTEDGRPHPDFDMLEIGALAKKIEQAGDSITLDEKDYEMLKARVKIIQKAMTYKFYEMLRRVMEPQKIELIEKCVENSKT